MKNNKKIKNILQSVIFVAVVVLIVVSAFVMVINGGKSSSPRFVFGKAFLWVETGSMKPLIDERSYILVTKYQGSDISEGDIVVFRCEDPKSEVYKALVVHRVVEVVDGGYKTKGDANPAQDSWTVKKDDIVAIYNKNLPVMTFLGRIFLSGAGLIIVIAFTLGVSAFVYIPDLVKAAKEISEEDHQAEIDRRVKEEVLRLEKENADKILQKNNTEEVKVDSIPSNDKKEN